MSSTFSSSMTFRAIVSAFFLLAPPTLGLENNSNTTTTTSSLSYTAFEDVSWAVWDVQLSSMLGDKQGFYDKHIQDCRVAAGRRLADAHCYVDEYHRMQMNMYQPRSMYNYTQTGFKKIRAPDDLFAAIKAFWEANRDKQGQTEWDGQISVYHKYVN